MHSLTQGFFRPHHRPPSLPSTHVAHLAHHLLTGACSKRVDVMESCIQLQNTEGLSDDKEATSPGLEGGSAGFWYLVLALRGFERHFSDDCLKVKGMQLPSCGWWGGEQRDVSTPHPPTFLLHVCPAQGEQRAESVVHKTKAS